MVFSKKSGNQIDVNEKNLFNLEERVATLEGTSGSGLTNPLTEDLDVNNNDLLNVEKINVNNIDLSDTFNILNGSSFNIFPSTAIDFGGNELFNLGIPMNNMSAVNKQYVDDRVIDSATAPLDITAKVLSVDVATDIMTGVTTHQIDIGDVTSTIKSATPKYVSDLIDNAQITQNILSPVDYGVNENVDIITGGSVDVGGEVNIPNGVRVLLYAQTDPKENGIYISNDAGAWSRSTDADTVGKLFKADVTSLNFIIGRFLCTIAEDITLDTDPVTFVSQYSFDDTFISVTKYDPARIYNRGDIVSYYNATLDLSALYQILEDGTNNIEPIPTVSNYLQLTGRQIPRYSQVSPNGDDDKAHPEPYGTIQKAIDDGLGDHNIELYRGSYSEDIIINNTDVYAHAEANIGSTGVSLTGNITLSSGEARTSLKAIEVLNSDDGSTPSLDIQGGNLGNNSFEQMFIRQATDGTSVKLSGAWEGINAFSFCNFNNGEIVIEGTPVNNPQVFLYSCIGDVNIRLKADCVLFITQNMRVNILEHTLGTIFIKRCGILTGLTSTSNTGLISIVNTPMYNDLTQSYITPNKTGTCPIRLSYVDRDRTKDKDMVGLLTSVPNSPRHILKAQGCVFLGLSNDTGYAVSLTIGTGTANSQRLRDMPDVFDTGFDMLAKVDEYESGWVATQGGEEYFTVKTGETGLYEIKLTCWRTEKVFGFTANNEKNAYSVGLQVKNTTILPTFTGTTQTDEILWLSTVDENSYPGNIVRTGFSGSTVELELTDGNVVTPVFYNEESSTVGNEVFNIIFSVKRIYP